jgi:hypothetical protein
MTLRLRSAIALAILGAAPWSASALELTLQPVTVTPGQQYVFTFKVKDEQQEEPPFIHARRDGVQAVATPHYQIWADWDETSEIKYSGRFRYFIYARPLSGGPFTVFRFESESGSFEDQAADVVFSVGEPGQAEQGTIELPIFGTANPSPLHGPSFTKPEDVNLASSKKISLTLRNELKKMPIEVESVSQTSTDSDLWKKYAVERVDSAAFKKLRVDPDTPADASAGGQDLWLVLEPRTRHALSTAMVPRGKEAVDDRLTVYVEYTTPGRASKTLRIIVPVRFVPWPPFLLLVTLVGVLFGSLLPLSDKDLTWERRWRILLTAVVVAITVETLALVLKANNSEVRLIGFELDPYQIPPALLIGVFVGMTGSKVFEKFEPILEKFWKSAK